MAETAGAGPRLADPPPGARLPRAKVARLHVAGNLLRGAVAGSIRVAPSDPLPWPFPLYEAASPPVFEAIRIRLVEWYSESGELVFGWSIEG